MRVSIFAVIAYIAANATMLVFFGFLAGLGPWPHINGNTAGPVAPALAVDVALVLLFGLQHSVMARPGWKRALTRILPAAAERSVYVLATAVVLLILCFAWRPLPAVVAWVEVPWARALLLGGFGAGVLVVAFAFMQIDGLALGGLRQAFEHAGWLAPRPEPGLVVRGLYRLVRHPIQSGFLLTLWCTPDLTLGRLLLATTMSTYIAIGIHFEERQLVATFGDGYRDYRRTTGAVVPRVLRSSR